MRIQSFFTESVSLTFQSLFSNKLRSLLSVLGVTIGIFCIVGILTITHSLERNIRNNIDSMGDNIVYVQRWPWMFSGNFEWWDYLNRPEATLREYKRMEAEMNTEVIGLLAFYFEFSRNHVKSPIEELTSVQVSGVHGDFFKIYQWDLAYGRNFNDLEFAQGRNVAIIGYNIATQLFPGADPIGKDIKLNGRKVTVIGVLDQQGNAIGMMQYDNRVILTGKLAEQFAKPNTAGVGSAIIIKGHESVPIKNVNYEIKRLMRSMRKLKPKEKDNFAINQLSTLSNQLNQTFVMLNVVGWILGGFSLLVGGFGIANIMYVSVKERTSIIGLQKSLGAKRKFILSQFLFEAVALCIVGAFIGIVMTILGATIVNQRFEDFHIFLSWRVPMIGVITAIVIGLIAGIAPAMKASKLDPVVAIRK